MLLQNCQLLANILQNIFVFNWTITNNLTEFSFLGDRFKTWVKGKKQTWRAFTVTACVLNHTDSYHDSLWAVGTQRLIVVGVTSSSVPQQLYEAVSHNTSTHACGRSQTCTNKPIFTQLQNPRDSRRRKYFLTGSDRWQSKTFAPCFSAGRKHMKVILHPWI